MKIVKLATWAILGWGSMQVRAQQTGLVTQYDKISSVLNPAYNGVNRAVQIDALTKSQWANFPGSPKINVVGVQMPLNRDFATGLSFQSMKIGKFLNANPISNFSVAADLAYHKKLGKNVNIATGLRLGMFSYNAQLGLLQADNPNDGAIADNNYNIKTPVIGGGLLLYGQQYFVGVSMPQYAIVGKEQFNMYNLNYVASPMFMYSAGYLKKWNKDWETKLTVQARQFKGLPMHLDANVYVYYKNQFMLGYGRRNNSADVLQVQFKFNEFVWITYGYEHGYIFDGQTPFSSHEFGVSYKFYQPSKQMYIEPRNY